MKQLTLKQRLAQKSDNSTERISLAHARAVTTLQLLEKEATNLHELYQKALTTHSKDYNPADIVRIRKEYNEAVEYYTNTKQQVDSDFSDYAPPKLEAIK